MLEIQFRSLTNGQWSNWKETKLNFKNEEELFQHFTWLTNNHNRNLTQHRLV